MKKQQVNVYFENSHFDYQIVSNLNDADLIVKENGTIVSNEIPKVDIPPAYHLEADISQLIINMGIPVNIKGYRFMLEALMIIVKNPKIMGSVTKELYPTIAKQFNTTPSRVERAIRHSIEVAFERGNKDLHKKFFAFSEDSKRKKPTNSEFLCAIADHFRLKLKKSK